MALDSPLKNLGTPPNPPPIHTPDKALPNPLNASHSFSRLSTPAAGKASPQRSVTITSPVALSTSGNGRPLDAGPLPYYESYVLRKQNSRNTSMYTADTHLAATSRKRRLVAPYTRNNPAPWTQTNEAQAIRVDPGKPSVAHAGLNEIAANVPPENFFSNLAKEQQIAKEKINHSIGQRRDEGRVNARRDQSGAEGLTCLRQSAGVAPKEVIETPKAGGFRTPTYQRRGQPHEEAIERERKMGKSISYNGSMSSPIGGKGPRQRQGAVHPSATMQQSSLTTTPHSPSATYQHTPPATEAERKSAHEAILRITGGAKIPTVSLKDRPSSYNIEMGRVGVSNELNGEMLVTPDDLRDFSTTVDLSQGTVKSLPSRSHKVVGYMGHIPRDKKTAMMATREDDPLRGHTKDHLLYTCPQDVPGYMGSRPKSVANDTNRSLRPNLGQTSSGSSQLTAVEGHSVRELNHRDSAKSHAMKGFFSRGQSGDDIVIAEQYYSRFRPYEGLMKTSRG